MLHIKIQAQVVNYTVSVKFPDYHFNLWSLKSLTLYLACGRNNNNWYSLNFFHSGAHIEMYTTWRATDSGQCSETLQFRGLFRLRTVLSALYQAIMLVIEVIIV